MKTILSMVAALAIGIVSVAHAQGPKTQPGTGQNYPMFGGLTQTPWFGNPQIRQELNLTDPQFAALDKAYQNAWMNYQKGVQTLDPALTDAQRQQRILDLQQAFYKSFLTSSDKAITDPVQRRRYNQLFYQYRGYGAFADPFVIESLNLTPAQRGQLNKFQQDWFNQVNKLGPIFQSDQQRGARELSQLQGKIPGQVKSVLTPSQQTSWQQMMGTPYNFGPQVYFPAPSTAAPGGKK